MRKILIYHRIFFFPSVLGRQYIQDKQIMVTFLGGVPTTFDHTNEQWDYPNAWPPLQHIVVKGLMNTGDEWAQELAYEIASRWVKSNFVAYNETGHMYEKVSRKNEKENFAGGSDDDDDDDQSFENSTTQPSSVVTDRVVNTTFNWDSDGRTESSWICCTYSGRDCRRTKMILHRLCCFLIRRKTRTKWREYLLLPRQTI